MFKHLERNHRLVMAALLIWALGEGLWYSNLRQLYLADLGASDRQVGMVLAAEAIARALLPIPAGYLCDRIGARRVMVVSWLIGVGGPLLMALAPTWQAAIPGLVLYALSAFASPSISAFLLQSTPHRNAPGTAERVLTTVTAAYFAGLIVSPAVGGVLADRFSIRACLWVSTALFVVSTLAVLTTQSAATESPSQKPDFSRLFHNAYFLRLAAYATLLFLALFVGYQFIPNFLRDVRGFTFSNIGLLFSLASAGTAIINLLAGHLSSRWSLAAVMGVYWLALLGVWRVSAFVGVMPVFMAVGSAFSARALITATAARIVSDHDQGLAFGMVETLMSVAVAIAAWIAGHLYPLSPAHDLPLIVSLAAIPMMVMLWFILRVQAQVTVEPAETPVAAAPGH